MSKKIITKKGFTLLEILLVVGIIAVLAAIVIIAINPSKQLAMVRNTERASNLKQIYNAMQQYYIDHGVYPGTMPSTLTEICNTGANPSTTTSITGTPCGTLVNLSDLVPVYLVAIPVDPLGSPVAFLTNIAQAATVGTGYLVGVNANNKITVQDMAGELGVVHTFGPESSQLCTAFTYSDWSTCSNSTRTRTITTSSPVGCTGGTSSTTESCIMSYNVIFNANGGTGSMSNQTMASGTSQTLTANSFTKDGYTFTGWALSSGGAVVYDDGESFTMQGGDVELWAQWSLISTLGNGLLVHYMMNQTSGTTLTNSKGGYSGTSVQDFSAMSTSSKSGMGNALSFNGSTDRILVGQVFPSPHDYSISFWFYLRKVNDFDTPFTIVGNVNGNGGCEYGASGGVTLAPQYLTHQNVQYFSGFCQGGFASSQNDPISQYTWYHLVFTITSAGSVMGYMNNLPLGSGPSSLITNNTISNLILGSGAWSSRWFDGLMDDFRIYDRIITTDEVSQLYNGGAGTEAE